jgi:hypothetical protein
MQKLDEDDRQEVNQEAEKEANKEKKEKDEALALKKK